VTAPHPDHVDTNVAPNAAAARFGHEVTDAEVEVLVQAVGSHNPVNLVGGFLLWAVPLAAAFLILSGHGNPLSGFWITPSRNEQLAAAALVLFAISVLFKRVWARRK
jgi:hypothetical protein